MRLKIYLYFLLSILFFPTTASAVESLPKSLIDFSSPAGLVLFQKGVNENALKLLSHFTTQKTTTYCGVASVVMVLNSIGIVQPVDSLHSPYHYFTQEDFFTDAVKKIIMPEDVQKKGITLSELSEIIRSYGLKATPYFANKLTLDTFRKTLKQALSHQQFVIVNFLRTELNEQGGGHHSPLAAYDKKTDRFLLLDVARYKYSAYWVKTNDLWKAVHTMDGDMYRGLIVISH